MLLIRKSLETAFSSGRTYVQHLRNPVRKNVALSHPAYNYKSSEGVKGAVIGIDLGTTNIVRNVNPIRYSSSWTSSPPTNKQAPAKDLNIEKMLEDALTQYKDEPWFVAGFYAATAILKPEINVHITKLKHSQSLVNRILMQIVVCDYVQMIKKRFPEINVCPPLRELCRKSTKAEEDIVREKYHWLEILNQGSRDMYVSLIIEHLEDAFRKEENISIIESTHLEKFNEFKLNFCESIAEGVEFGNKLVAYRRSGKLILKERLNVYDNALDPYLTIFYNALVGKVEWED